MSFVFTPSVLNSLVDSLIGGNGILLLGYVPIFLVQDCIPLCSFWKTKVYFEIVILVQWLVSPITGVVFKASWTGFPSVGAVQYQQLHFVMMTDA